MPEQRRDGWFNLCHTCGGWYWVRAVDVGQRKMRRYVSDESDERHDCTRAGNGEARSGAARTG